MFSKWIGSNYLLTKEGNIISFHGGTPKLVSPNTMKSGYARVSLYLSSGRKDVKVHRLVAEHFIPNPDNKPFINHRNGVKTDNSVNNLEWVTAKENTLHAWKKGLTRPAYKKVRCLETGRVFNSMKDARDWASLKNTISISEACNGRKKTAGGYRWEKVV